MKVSDKGIDLIKEFEGLRLKAYKCPGNVWTIGFGHTENVKEGMIITKEQAEVFLKKDLEIFENAINELVDVSLTQNMFDALISFIYNVGIRNFKNSTLLKRLNEQDFFSAANEFLKWNKSNGKVLPGLVRRREAERKLFLEPMI